MRIIDEGEKHITLQHSDGHQVMIAKHAVSKNTLEKIRKFDQGGEVNYGVSKENTLDPQKTADFKKAFSGESQGQSNPKLAQSQVKNPQPVQHYDAGGAVPDPTEGLSPHPSQQVSFNPADQSQSPQTQESESPVGNFVGKHVVAPVIQGFKDTGSAISRMAGGIGSFVHGVEQGAGIEQPKKNSDVQLASTSSQQPSGFQNADLKVGASPQQGQNELASTYTKYLPNYEQAYQQGMQGYQNAGDELQKGLQDYQTHFNDINNQIEALKNNINNGMIDPNHLFNDQTTGQKMSTAIGLLLGGLSSGMTGQANPVMQFMNDQINRDIDAQKANIGKNNTLLEANLRQLGNLDQATNMTRLQQMAMLETKLGQGTLSMQMLPIMQQMALQKAAFNGAGNQSGGNAAFMIRATVPDKEQPAVSKELKDMESMRNIGMNALDSFDQVNHMLLGGAFSPKQRDALIEPVLAQMVKDSEGRITPADTKMIRALFPSATDFGQQTRDLKRNKLVKFLQEKMNSPLLDQYFIPKPALFTGHSMQTGPGFQQVSFKR